MGVTTIYICSAPRCGSTLTDMFLGGHSQAGSLGEINFLGKTIALDANCACGVKLRDCESWKWVFDSVLATHGLDLRQQPYAFRLWDALASVEIDSQHQTRALERAITLRRPC